MHLWYRVGLKSLLKLLDFLAFVSLVCGIFGWLKDILSISLFFVMLVS